MKILQFAASNGYGGMEKAFVELSNGLAEKHSVTALLLRGCEYSNRFSEKVNLVELSANPTKHNPFLHYELYKKITTINPDIIHTHAVKGTQLVRRAGRFLGIKHVGTKHNDRKGRVFSSLDWVVAVSEKVRESIDIQSGAVVEVIYNGINEQKQIKTPKNDNFTILTVGRLDRIKGFDLLIEQVAKLNFPYRLLIVGEGPERRALTNLVAELQLQESIFLLGFRDNIAQLMHEAHVVVMPSHREGCSNVMIEAIFYAPVLLATPAGAVVEILPEKFQALQAGLGDKIIDLYQNYDEYTNRFDLVRQEKKNLFRQSSIVRKYEALYQKILTN